MSGQADAPVPAGSQPVGPPGRNEDEAGTPAGWTGVVLAGGGSRRFGGLDKTRLPLGGRTLRQRALDVLAPVCATRLLVGGLAATDATEVVPDRYPGEGPLGGILTALDRLTTPYALVLAADLPFLSVDLLRRLQAAARGVDVAWLEAADGRRPLCVAVARRCGPALQAHWTQGARRVRDLGALGPAAIVAVDAGSSRGALWNVNDPLTYARALEMAEHDCPAC